MVCSGDTYHMENQSTVLRCGLDGWFLRWYVNYMELSDKLQPSESTCNLYPPRFPLLVALQVLIEVLANSNTHCIVFEEFYKTH